MGTGVDRHRAQPLQTACMYWLRQRIQSVKRERVDFLVTLATSVRWKLAKRASTEAVREVLRFICI